MPSKERITVEALLYWAFQREAAHLALYDDAATKGRGYGHVSATGRVAEIGRLGALVDMPGQASTSTLHPDADLVADTLRTLAPAKVVRWIANHAQAGTKPTKALGPHRFDVVGESTESLHAGRPVGWPLSMRVDSKGRGRPARFISKAQAVEETSGPRERARAARDVALWDSTLERLADALQGRLRDWALA